MSEASADRFDFFVSHASEDKDLVARPIATKLRERGFNIWYDEFSLRVGDRLLESINQGLLSSAHGVVVLSEAFFAKGWTRNELDALASREAAEGGKLILPVWHELESADVIRHSPMLAGRVAARTRDGIDDVVEQLIAAVRPPAPREKRPPQWRSVVPAAVYSGSHCRAHAATHRGQRVAQAHRLGVRVHF